jgi:hypothetical protein
MKTRLFLSFVVLAICFATLRGFSQSAQITNSLPIETPDEIMEMAVNAFAKQVNQPIEFYGRVVDENGNSVAGANVEFVVSHYRWNSNGLPRDGEFNQCQHFCFRP